MMTLWSTRFLDASSFWTYTDFITIMSTFLHYARQKLQNWPDILFRGLTRLSAFSVLILLAAIIVSLVVGSLPAIKAFGFGFLGSSEWDPVKEQFGALVPIVGTVVTATIALVIAVPVSFGIALFLTELSPRWLRRPLGVAVELLAGIPSIIYGMWGLFVFCPTVWRPYRTLD
jgi:phosphate transport system permease protein